MNIPGHASAAILGLACLVGPASADPCEGPLPERAGVIFAGTVRHVGDGDSLCVGRSADPNDWIEVRLADFNAPELREPNGPAAKAALVRVTKGQTVVCRTQKGRSGRVRSFDRVIARCSIGSDSLADLLRRAGVRPGGN
jgi:endonuclease YncB( thermonuclease family)